MSLGEIGEQARARGTPAEELSGARARRRVVELGDHAEETADELSGLVSMDALGRHVDAATDRLGDRAERDALVGRRVSAEARGRRLQREAIQVCGIER